MGAERAAFLADDLLGNVAERELADLAGMRLSEEAFKVGAKEALGQVGKGATADAAERVLAVNKAAFLGGGDEGMVFSNGDGSVTKVFQALDHDVHATKAMYGELDQMGVKVPQVLEVGSTAEGSPAMRIQQIGDGDNLQTQLLLGEVNRGEMPALMQQYDGMAKTLQDKGVRVDWQLKNMTWHEGDLYLLDPSYLKRDQALSQVMVDHMRPH
jgi:hypothetical protein